MASTPQPDGDARPAPIVSANPPTTVADTEPATETTTSGRPKRVARPSAKLADVNNISEEATRKRKNPNVEIEEVEDEGDDGQSVRSGVSSQSY